MRLWFSWNVMSLILSFVAFMSLLFTVAKDQLITFSTRSCGCISWILTDGTYGRFRGDRVTTLHSGRPKGAALTHTFKTYRLPFRMSGMTSPVFSQISAPARLPNRPSNPMSAQRLRLNNPL